MNDLAFPFPQTLSMKSWKSHTVKISLNKWENDVNDLANLLFHISYNHFFSRLKCPKHPFDLSGENNIELGYNKKQQDWNKDSMKTSPKTKDITESANWKQQYDWKVQTD